MFTDQLGNPTWPCGLHPFQVTLIGSQRRFQERLKHAPKTFALRQIAKLNGWTLNEYGLYDEHGKAKKISSEKDIFDYLGMEYLEPSKR